mmetsp:Transcript_16746/g.47785  ORF Transcript_16746/g.47785 Transcript_16746/m.47785 type:complete len:92 (+) Transcript_16746:169-444(+)
MVFQVVIVSGKASAAERAGPEFGQCGQLRWPYLGPAPLTFESCSVRADNGRQRSAWVSPALLFSAEAGDWFQSSGHTSTAALKVKLQCRVL